MANESFDNVTLAELIADDQNSLGIKETSELLRFVLRLGVEAATALEDGKIGLGDIRSLWDLSPTVIPAFNGIGSIPAELGDLTEAELAELLAVATAEIGELDNDVLKGYVTHALNIGINLIKFVTHLIQDIKQFRR
jgi:hypothetical protein